MRARVKPELIRWVRRNAGLSVADVAKKAGTSVSIVHQWEDGTVQPTVRQLRLLANATQAPAGNLLSRRAASGIHCATRLPATARHFG